MSIRVLVNGASGKMGQATVKTLEHHVDFTLVGTTDREHDLAIEIKKNQADVVVDFTNAEAVFANVQIILKSGARPVIGTTGLLKEDIEKIQRQCQKLKRGGIIAPNFSLGAVLMMIHARAIAKYFPHVEIIEMHHDGKLDSPSGTAIQTAEMLATARSVPDVKKVNKEIVPGARGACYQDIHIHSIRLPGLIAHQQVLFGATGETLTLRHDAMDRQCFMPGVMLAIEKVMTLDQLVYGLEHVL